MIRGMPRAQTVMGDAFEVHSFHAGTPSESNITICRQLHRKARPRLFFVYAVCAFMATALQARTGGMTGG
jgi:UDP-2,3-diacylglucosamine pyrophosphatase LpxH